MKDSSVPEVLTTLIPEVFTEPTGTWPKATLAGATLNPGWVPYPSRSNVTEPVLPPSFVLSTKLCDCWPGAVGAKVTLTVNVLPCARVAGSGVAAGTATVNGLAVRPW